MQMTKELTVFKYSDQQIRIIMIDAEPWFVRKDVMCMLGFYNTTRTLRSLPPEEKGWTHQSTPGGIQRMAIINESGLYRLLFRSRKPEAKDIREKIAEYLPVLRKQNMAIKGSTGRSTPGVVSTEQVIIETHNMVKSIVQDVNVRLCRLEQTVSSIQSNQEMEFKLLKKGTLPEINSIDWRARLNQDIRNISLKFNWPEHDCWNMVYYEDKYRNHRDIKAIARNRGCRPIQVAEEKGWLLDLCAIARGIINGEIVTEYRAGAYA